jgi:hypothetical protein
MGKIRPFVEADICEVARLHGKVFGHDRAASDLDRCREYLARVFLESPFRDDQLSSLVYDRGDGCVLGFLGVVPRRMSLDGRRFQAAISSQFVVEPGCSLVAVALAKAFLAGPQDVSIADEANDGARRIWEGLGGSTSFLQSMYWTRPLRPASFAFSFIRRRRPGRLLAMTAAIPAWIVDQAAARIPGSRLFQAARGSESETPAMSALLASIADVAGDRTLRVEYDDATLSWLLGRARQRKAGHLVTSVVRDREALRGSYLYHLDPAGMAGVLQIAARSADVPHVLDHLFHGAWRRGAVAVSGRLEPRLLQTLSEKACLFHRRGPWMLVSARRRELLQHFESGRTFFSRLDGEWCLGF